ncbi:MAG: SIR2 family protein [Candidatus Brocadiales bacterium]|nr:SIR2 family protein [Candidatus Brocadiales bacterium]
MSKAYTDNNVYIFGAGFPVDAGLPVVSNFLNKMKDSVEWLSSKGRSREISAVERVLDFRLKAAAAACRVYLNVENIEELFSLASASGINVLAKDMTLAIAATLDFAKNTTPDRTFPLLSEDTGKPLPWKRESNSRFSSVPEYVCLAYDFYMGLIGRFLTEPSPNICDTVITFNYDLLIEDALFNLKIPFTYGLPDNFVDYVGSRRCATTSEVEKAIKVLKLHGSLNWSKSDTDRLSIHPDYSNVLNADREPLLIPPTWRKNIGGHIETIWDETVQALRYATRIIVIGFSMPLVDMHFKYLIAEGLRENISLRKIIFVNPSIDELSERALTLLRSELEDQDILQFIKATTAEFFFDKKYHQLIHRELRPQIRIVSSRSSEDLIPNWALRSLSD